MNQYVTIFGGKERLIIDTLLRKGHHIVYVGTGGEFGSLALVVPPLVGPVYRKTKKIDSLTARPGARLATCQPCNTYIFSITTCDIIIRQLLSSKVCVLCVLCMLCGASQPTSQLVTCLPCPVNWRRPLI